MKNWIAILCLFIGGTSMASNIKLKVEGIEVKRGGQIIIFVFKEDGFPKDHSKATEKIVRKASEESFEVDLIDPPSIFAIKILHDEDENGVVTKNWTGIYPKEGLGFTNDQSVSLTGPPGFKKSAVQKESIQGSLNIKIRYP